VSYRKGETLIHIGANSGQEVESYADQCLNGYHIEAIPQLFEELDKHCANWDNQIAICACLADQIGKEVEFNIASNNGESSSMLDLGRHQLAYPHVSMTERLTLSTTTLDHLIESGVIKHCPDHLVIDVQGAELLVLHGCSKTLANQDVKTITVETSAEPLYENGASFAEVLYFLSQHGYHLKKAEFNIHGWCDALFSLPWWPSANFVLNPKPEGVNVAVNAECIQSSISPWSISEDEAKHVLEARRNGSYAFHTADERQPWLLIDLGTPHRLNEIIVFNRIVDGPDLAERANSLMVSASIDGYSWKILHQPCGPFGGIDGDPLRVPCAEQSLRFVRLQLTAAEALPLHLDTVEIYAIDMGTAQ
jgi:FkbM family methyltransferase